MKLYSCCDFKNIEWPQTYEGQRQKSLLEPFLKHNTKELISNIETQFYILNFSEHFIGISVNDKEYLNSYVCSLYSYLLYAEEEMERHNKKILKTILTPFLSLIKLGFKASKINKVVIVNNFLFSTNLLDNLKEEEIKKIHDFLLKKFPHHTLLFRSLNIYLNNNIISFLKKLDYDFITSRSVYIFDPKLFKELPSKKRWIYHKDLKLSKQNGLVILQEKDFTLEDSKAIKDLYDELYLKKYSPLNPAFTPLFFEHSLKTKSLSFKGINYNNRLVGVIGYFKKANVLATPIVGYDPSLKDSFGIYRLLTSLMIKESLDTNSIFHMSAGVGHFKRQRGAFQELESMAVFCDHLPIYRRFVWKILAFLFNKIGTPLLKKQKL